MKPVFIDTCFVVGLVLENDQLHAPAIQWADAACSERITTEYVLVEIADTLCTEQSRSMAAKIIRKLRASNQVTIVPASGTLLQRGLTLFERREDKRWSLTDCISFIIMNDYSLEDALTADRHFEQAGFRALLRLPVPDQAQ